MNDSPVDPTPTIQPRPAGLIGRVQAILFKPSPTWDVIATEQASVKSLYLGYIIPLAAIGPVAQLIGLSVFGVGFAGFAFKPPLISILLSAIVSFGLNLAMVYVMALIIDALAPSFDGRKNFLQALKLMAYAMTAAWIAAIFNLIPTLGILAIVGLYSFYLLYLGMPKLMGSPPEKSLGYTIVAIIISIVLWVIVGFIGGLFVSAGMVGSAYKTAANSQATGTVSVPGLGTVDLDKIQKATDQMAAEASAQAAGTTTVSLADPQSLLSLMPASYMGAARSDDSTQAGGVGGISVATAEANYVIDGNTIELTVTDLGSVGGLGAFAAAMNVNASSSSAGGYETVTTRNGQMVTESYNRDSKQGSYTVVRNGRISVEASGTVDSIDTLKNLVNGLDAGRLEQLAKN